MPDFWIPKHKYELVSALKRYYPNVNWNGKSKKQLYAIYFTIRKKNER